MEIKKDSSTDTFDLDQKIADLVEFIYERAEIPMSAFAVAALLESRGLRDIDAIEIYGKKHIFALAQEVFNLTIQKDKKEKKQSLESKSRFKKAIKYTKWYIEGSAVAIPMVGQILAILLLRYSLWAWLDFSLHQASLVAIGTIASFIITGGVIQSIGREGTFYLGVKNPMLLEQAVNFLFKTGILLGVSAFGLLIVFNMIFPYFEAGELFVSISYGMSLTMLWLVLAILFILNANIGILLCTVLGTFIVYLVKEHLQMHIYFAHWGGILSSFLFSSLWAKNIISKMKAKDETKETMASLPRMSILFYILEPFILFGTCYFFFLFCDRIVGWSASSGQLPLILWFRTSYELGMDWALCSLVLTFAVLNYTVNHFNHLIIPMQQKTEALKVKRFNIYFKKFHQKQILLLIATCFISTLVVYFGAMWVKNNNSSEIVNDFFSASQTYFTFWWAVVGYSLLAFAQLNALFFFSLSRPYIVIKNISIAVGVNLIVGFMLSRMISYEYSVCGLTFGAATYAWLMFRSSQKMLKDLDYYYYSAF